MMMPLLQGSPPSDQPVAESDTSGAGETRRHGGVLRMMTGDLG